MSFWWAGRRKLLQSGIYCTPSFLFSLLEMSLTSFLTRHGLSYPLYSLPSLLGFLFFFFFFFHECISLSLEILCSLYSFYSLPCCDVPQSDQDCLRQSNKLRPTSSNKPLPYFHRWMLLFCISAFHGGTSHSKTMEVGQALHRTLSWEVKSQMVANPRQETLRGNRGAILFLFKQVLEKGRWHLWPMVER